MKGLFLTFALGASAFPAVTEFVERSAAKPGKPPKEPPGVPGAVEISREETNCGPIACTSFSPDQLVSVHGKHRYLAPGPDDLRGPCPGLNAAANHNYLDRSGVQDIDSTVTGLGQLYAFEDVFAAGLAVFSAVISGDIVQMKWSIGGAMPFVNPGGILYPPQGISYTHNRYEGDVSIARFDAYMNKGNAYALSLDRFQRAYEIGMDNDRYTLHKFRILFGHNVEYSIHKNPYYFSPPLAGAVVPPAAYNFVINFMSNRTKEEPSGYLDGKVFKSFFAISGDYPNFKWHPGQERVPENWYRRTPSNRYGAVKLAEDDAIGWAAFPQYLKIGGNTNGTNTYQGVDLSALSGGSVTDENKLEGFNLACLAFQGQQQVIPDELKGTINDGQVATKVLGKAFAPILAQLKCKPLANYDTTLFSSFPGYSYSPKGG